MPARLATTDNLRDADCKSKALGEARVIRNLAGRLRYAYELATGAQVVSGDPRCVGPNPAGDYGCNASGPPWGGTPQAPHAGRGGMTPDTTYFIGQKNLLPAIGDFGTAGTTHQLALRFWVQGYETTWVEDYHAPLAKLYPVLLMRTLSGVNIDVDVVCRSHNGIERSATITVASTTTAQYEPTDCWFDTLPGRVVPARLLLTCSSAVGVALCGYEISVTNRL